MGRALSLLAIVAALAGAGLIAARVVKTPAAFTGGIMVSAALASQLAPRLGVRPVAVVGFLLAAAGLALLTQLPTSGSYLVDVLPGLVLSALGIGAVFMPLTLIATTGLADQDQGLASGLFNTSQQIGGALGLAILSTLATSKMSSAAGAYPTAALVTGFHWAFGAAALISLAALVVMVSLLRRRHVARIEEQVACGEPAMVAV